MTPVKLPESSEALRVAITTLARAGNTADPNKTAANKDHAGFNILRTDQDIAAPDLTVAGLQ
jgi:hypothetical protein